MRKYTEEMHRFILEHHKGIPVRKLTKLFNEHFNTDVSYMGMKSYLANRKMKNGSPKRVVYSKIFPKEIAEYIQQNYKGIAPKGMSAILNEKFGTSYTHEQLKSYYANHKLDSGITGYFEKGHIPENKGKRMLPEIYAKARPTMFKKGHVPKNYRPVGSERINKGGYIEVKIADPNKWELKHRVIWEQEHGRIPEGHILLFLDGNRKNMEISNLKLVKKRENLILNRYGIRGQDSRTMETAVNLAKLIDTTNAAKGKTKIKGKKNGKNSLAE